VRLTLLLLLTLVAAGCWGEVVAGCRACPADAGAADADADEARP